MNGGLYWEQEQLLDIQINQIVSVGLLFMESRKHKFIEYSWKSH